MLFQCKYFILYCKLQKGGKLRAIYVIAGLFLIAGTISGNSGWRGSTEITYARILNYNENCDAVEYLPGTTAGKEHQQIPEELDMVSNPSRYAPLWGSDRLVSNAWNLSVRSKISFDYGNDGYIYAAAITATDNQQDSIIILRSSDLGLTWNLIYVIHNYSDNLLMQDFEMRVDRNAAVTPFLYFVLTDSNYTDNQREMWFFTYDQATSTLNAVLFDPDTSASFVSPTNVAMDITGDAVPKIWITYNALPNGWRSVFSTDGGSTWAYQNHASTGGGGCDVCVGPDDYVYIVNIYTDNNNVIRMNRRQFSAYGTYLYASPQTSEERYFPVVASEMEASYGSNVVHVMYQTGSGTAARIKNSYSTDGGVTWTLDDFWSPIGDVLAVRPYVRCGWNTDQFIGIATRTDLDSLGTAWTSNQIWGTVTYVNNYQPTGEITPQGFVVDSTGRQLVYRQWGSSNLWYDYFNMPNSVEEIVQGTGQEMKVTFDGRVLGIHFSVETEQNVNIDIFDITGRNIRNLCDRSFTGGDHVLTYDIRDLKGSCIISFRAGDFTFSEKIFSF